MLPSRPPGAPACTPRERRSLLLRQPGEPLVAQHACERERLKDSPVARDERPASRLEREPLRLDLDDWGDGAGLSNLRPGHHTADPRRRAQPRALPGGHAVCADMVACDSASAPLTSINLSCVGRGFAARRYTIVSPRVALPLAVFRGASPRRRLELRRARADAPPPRGCSRRAGRRRTRMNVVHSV